MPASWTLGLVDVNGNPLTEGGLTLASKAVTTLQPSTPMMIQALLPISSDEAAAIAGDTETDAYVVGYRTPAGGGIEQRRLRFYGSVWVDEVQGAEGVVMLTALDQMAMLAKRFTNAQFAPADLGNLLMQMVDTTNSVDGETGILTDALNITPSSTIDLDLRTNTPTIMSVAQQFAGQLDGCETWVEPIDLASGKMCELFVAPRRGGASDAVFGFGTGTEDNCTDMSRTRDKMLIENDVYGYADGLVTSNKFDATSVAALRRLVGYTAFTGETEQTVLDARTQGRLADRSSRAKIAEYRATPASNAPALFDDYDIGDDVTLHFHKGAIEWQVRQRAMMAKLELRPGGPGEPLREFPAEVEFRGLES